ncbi:RNA-directed DNA polymerase-like protein [Cucumis melo var. makuwa]|uniref:RNA-directed DNA polymerase-like protein n=1 Tax=Cucumis melo var. makuwa TaxID=1194695 RepID=A0A5A7VPU0_CUCMM|nr:RNA-directed DNA polymerase-like protein [Cucumis melo var. makuwa]
MTSREVYSRCPVDDALEIGLPTPTSCSVSRVKILEPKPFYGARDAKALENFILISSQKTWAKTKLYEKRVQDLTSAYVAVERLFGLSNNSQDTSETNNDKVERVEQPRRFFGCKDGQLRGGTGNRVSTRTLGETILKDILCVLEKYSDVILDSLPKSLLLQWVIDHEIELLPRAKPAAKNAYRMALPELVELRKTIG